MLSLASSAIRQSLVELRQVDRYDSHSEWFKLLSRLTKICAIVLGMSINYEKEVLNMFMIFQSYLKLDELAVAKEDYRRVES